MFGIFIESGGICLQKRSHLINEGSGSAGAGAVHALFYIAVFKINDLGIFAAQLNGNVGQRRNGFNGRGLCNDLLNEGNLQIVGQRQSAGAGDDRVNPYIAELLMNFLQNRVQSFTNLSVVAAIITEQKIPFMVEQGGLDGGGSDINSESIVLRNHVIYSCDGGVGENKEKTAAVICTVPVPDRSCGGSAEF